MLLQEISRHVNASFQSSSLVAHLCSDPQKMLALLFLLAICLRVKRTIRTLAQLVRGLPDQLLAILQPEHVVEYIQAHLPRGDQASETFIIFAFDEVRLSRLQFSHAMSF